MAAGGARTKLDIGKDICDWCSDHKLKREELAYLLGVSEKTITRIWNGTHAPSLKSIRILAKLMDKPADFFLESCNSEEDERLSYIKTSLHKKNNEKTLHNLSIENEITNLDQRLEEAMEKIKNEDDLLLKEHMLLQCELILETARVAKRK